MEGKAPLLIKFTRSVEWNKPDQQKDFEILYFWALAAKEMSVISY